MGLCGNVDSVAPDDPNAPVAARKKSKGIFGFMSKGNGRMEGPPAAAEASAAPSRDGLHSAPSGQTTPAAKDETIAPKPEVDRAGLHTAPPQERKPHPTPVKAEPQPKPEGLSEFILESTEGVTAADADAYLAGVLDGKLVKELRAPEWAGRVRGLEALQDLLKRFDTKSPAEQAALFKAMVTVLARLLQDKVVPVYLPALQLLESLFAPALLRKLPQHLPPAAVHVFAPQLVTRAGSSNQRAREDSASQLLRLARNPQVGGSVVGPHMLRPLPNNKNQHAALGRLELLNGVVTDSGLGVRCVGLEAACDFIMPFSDSASDKIREASMGLLSRLHQQSPDKTIAHVQAHRPSLAQALTISINPSATEGALAHSASSGRHKLAPLARTNGPPGSAADRTSGNSREGSPAAHHRTPPAHDARAKARKTAAELGAREAPAAPAASQKKLRHPPAGAENSFPQRQRTPTPIPGQTRPPSKGSRTAVDSRPDSASKSLFDEMEEGLMESILDADAEAAAVGGA